MIEHHEQPGERAVVADFGAAAIRDAGSRDASSVMLASFHYMAPERVQSRSSPASDVYSFSAVAIEMFTGVRYSSLSDGSEPGLRESLVGLPGPVITLLAAGLAYAPEARPQDIREFAGALASAMEAGSG